jgi:hypothetical protein
MRVEKTRSPALRRRRLGLAAGLLASALLAWPVIAFQQPGAADPAAAPAPPPKSLLPDGFDEPASDRVAAPVAPLLLPARPTDTAAPAAPEATAPGNLTAGLATPGLAPGGVDPFALAAAADTGLSGPLTQTNGGMGPALFSGSNGRFLAGLNRRVDAPLGSRWAAIMLRRALLSQSATPYGITTGDWIGSRAYTLMRMGEIDGAKALVDGLPVDRYTPMLYRVAGQVALAAADLGGLCPIAVTGRSLFAESLWQMAVGMCAAMQGDDITAAGIFDDLRSDPKAEPFDVRLGERVATIAGGAGRASNLNWDEAPALNLFRYGVATAAGVPVPADKLPALGPARFGWLVRSAGVAPDVRLASLRPAAVLGTVSVAEFSSGIAALSPGDAAAGTPAGLQRTAFAGASLADRRAALRQIWASGGAADRYGALLESASAAARLPIANASADDSPTLIAALLAAGNTAAARRWWPIADAAGGATRAEAWALLATGSGGVPITPADFKAWRSAADADDRRAGLLLAALTGLGAARGSGWNGLKDDLLPTTTNSWTRAIDAAAAAGRTGEVVILSATGLQGPWAQVSPLHLAHITAALTRVGLGAEARLIAAEAMTRA